MKASRRGDVGRTIPSFRMAQLSEFRRWRRFRKALLRSERERFREMLDEARFHISASSMAVRTSVFEGVFMAILLHHREELEELGASNDDGKESTSLVPGEMEEELRSWEKFARALRESDRVRFEGMLAAACEEMPAMQASASPFPVHALLMGILFSQHKAVEDLKAERRREPR